MNNQKYILRICDLVLSFFAIIFLSPFLIIILFCCFLDSKEPIFIQKRVGQNLRPFYLYKFRTMKKNTPSLATHLITKKNVTKLGRIIKAKELWIITDVDSVYLNFGKDDQKPIKTISSENLSKLYKSGQFQEGSIRPKIKAALHFLKYHGEKVIVTSIPCIKDALNGKAGTEIRKTI